MSVNGINEWEKHYQEMLKQKPDKKEIKINNLDTWLEEHPVDFYDEELNRIARQYIILQRNRAISVGKQNNLNAMGYYIIAKDRNVQYNQILYFDFTWFVNNIYDFSNDKVLDLKNKIYSRKYKYFLIDNYPVNQTLGTINEKNSDLARNMIVEQMYNVDDLKVVISHPGQPKDGSMIIRGFRK